MLAVSDLFVSAAGTVILDGVTLSIAPGEVVALVGPNGAGKSTLLSALSGSMRVDEGSAVLDGVPLSNWSPAVLARRRAVLSQHFELTFALSALEVVFLGRSPHAGLSSREEDTDAVRSALEETEVAHLASRDYTTLSGGERQRVHLARVLAQINFGSQNGEGDRFVLLDEPTSSLDPAHQHGTLATARRVAKCGLGVCVVLHDLNLAAMYADRLVVMQGGRIVDAGPPQAVLTETMVRRVFDLEVSVVPHPTRQCPCLVPL